MTTHHHGMSMLASTVKETRARWSLSGWISIEQYCYGEAGSGVAWLETVPMAGRCPPTRDPWEGRTRTALSCPMAKEKGNW